jgi:F-box and leucine-rich repeat protein 2/20
MTTINDNKISSFLLHFTSDFLSSFVSNWLDVRSFLVLDVAMTNKNERSQWLGNLKKTQSSSVDEWHHDQSSIRWLINRGIVNASHIRIRNDAKWQITDSTFDGAIFPLLRSLDLTECRRISDTLLSALIKVCPVLLSVTVDNCPNISDIGIAAVATGCPQLETISINGCLRVTNAGVVALAETCSELHRIKFDGCYQITDAGMFALANVPDLLGISCRRFYSDAQREVEESYFDLASDERVTDEGFQKLIEGCPRLQDIDISGTALSAAAIAALAHGCPQLLNVSIQNSVFLDNACFQAFADGCPSLQSIDFTDFQNLPSYSGLIAIANNCPKLQCINIRSDALSDDIVCAFADNCPDLVRVHIGPGGSRLAEYSPDPSVINDHPGPRYMVEHVPAIGFRSIKSLALGCPKLQHITLDLCRIEADMIEALAEGCTDLRTFHLSDQSFILDDSMIGRLLEGCPKLSKVDFKGSISGRGFSTAYCLESAVCNFVISDTGLSDLSFGCSNLVSVTLEECNSISDSGLEALSFTCPQLLHVKLTYVPRGEVQIITDAGISISLSHSLSLSLSLYLSIYLSHSHSLSLSLSLSLSPSLSPSLSLSLSLSPFLPLCLSFTFTYCTSHNLFSKTLTL